MLLTQSLQSTYLCILLFHHLGNHCDMCMCMSQRHYHNQRFHHMALNQCTHQHLLQSKENKHQNGGYKLNSTFIDNCKV